MLKLLPKLKQFGIDDFWRCCHASTKGDGVVGGYSLRHALVVQGRLEHLLSDGGRSKLILERLLHGTNFADLHGETLRELLHGFGDRCVQVDHGNQDCGLCCCWRWCLLAGEEVFRFSVIEDVSWWWCSDILSELRLILMESYSLIPQTALIV